MYEKNYIPVVFSNVHASIYRYIFCAGVRGCLILFSNSTDKEKLVHPNLCRWQTLIINSAVKLHYTAHAEHYPVRNI